jgi:hypothetical protein
MKTCVDFIMKNNCPDPLICGINCATDEEIIRNEMKIVPFNNHGVNYLRIRTCLFKVHSVSGDYVRDVDANLFICFFVYSVSKNTTI